MPTLQETNILYIVILIAICVIQTYADEQKQLALEMRIIRNSTSTYQAFPTLDALELIKKPDEFFEDTGFPPHIWMDYILKPLHEYLKWPRQWFHKVNINAKYYPFKKSSAQISRP
eukprot:297632_1